MATPVSGPGPMSQRTDMKQKMRDLPDASYGEQASYKDLQRSAPLSASGQMDFNSLFGNAADRVIPMGAESTQPQTPVTDGAAAGPGAGIEALNLPDQRTEDLRKLVPHLPVLEYMGNQQGASWAMRNLVRKVKSVR